jgi:hypothetical protein
MDLPTAQRRAASSHYSRPALTPRSDPRDELRRPCAPRAPNHVRWPKWLRLPAQNWLCFVARFHVESTFSAIKRKFGDSVMSKNDAAMINEVLCKILCHNLTCLVQEQETLGIVPVFWKDEEKETTEDPAILPMVQLQRN